MDDHDAVTQEYERIDQKRGRDEPLTDQELRFVTVVEFVGSWDHGGILGPIGRSSHEAYCLVLDVLKENGLHDMVQTVVAVKELYFGKGRAPDDREARWKCISAGPNLQDARIDDAFSGAAFNRAMAKLIAS